MIQQWLVESAGIEPHILKANNKVIRGCFKVWELMNTSPPVFKGQLNLVEHYSGYVCEGALGEVNTWIGRLSKTDCPP